MANNQSVTLLSNGLDILHSSGPNMRI